MTGLSPEQTQLTFGADPDKGTIQECCLTSCDIEGNGAKF